MGSTPRTEIDHWLADGGLVVTANERAARALRVAYHRRRHAEGLTAWPTPGILAWAAFVRKGWNERATDGHLVLNSAQEQALWSGIIAKQEGFAAYLEAPRRRLAEMASSAHELLCSHAPKYLTEAARSGWDRDAGAFSSWLSQFATTCQTDRLVSLSRIPLELLSPLREDRSPRQRLLIVGFDRMQPVQRDLFNAWGQWRELPPSEPAGEVHHWAAADPNSELDACAAWATKQIEDNTDSRILIVDQNISVRRGQIERALLRRAGPDVEPVFEFSLGVPLIQVPIARAVLLLLSWLNDPLQENEIDWLFSSGFAAPNPRDMLALQEFMRDLRRRGLARTEWSLTAFLAQRSESAVFPDAWILRLSQVRQRLSTLIRRKLTPSDWAGRIPGLLDALGLPAEHQLSSAEFQAWSAWEQALDTCASLGFDGRLMGWKEFLSALTNELEHTLFAPESTDAPIQITGPAEAAGLRADAIWFMGTHQDAWPTAGSTHPFLPLRVQRDSSMPHATPALDWELAHAIATRLLASAPVVHFSYAVQTEDAETRCSGVISQLAGPAAPLAAYPERSRLQSPLTEPIQDLSRIPFPLNRAPGGSRVLTDQSQCAFKAFATARLGAQTWEPAEYGLTAAQRGLLLHAVLHAIWAGPPNGLRSLEDLRARAEVAEFVAQHVENVIRQKLPSAVRDRMPERYLDLEQVRLTRLISEWLQYEATRPAFSVEMTEIPGEITIAGISFKLRLDRIDRIEDGSLLVIDYKTGDVSPKDWDLPRPADLQLPLYACLAIDEGEQLAGLVFAKLRPGEQEFAGRVRDASKVLMTGIGPGNDLVKKPLTQQQVVGWKQEIDQLAHDFLAGRADVNPRDFPKTCARCGLHTLCRVLETGAQLEEETRDDILDEASDE